MGSWQDDAEPVEATAAPAGHWTEDALPMEGAAPALVARSGAASGPSGRTAAFRGAVQGALLGLGTQINGGAQALGQLVLPQAAGGDEGFNLGKFLANYRQARDSFHRENEAAQSAHPWAYLAGNLGGGILTTPLLMGSPAGATGLASLPARFAGGGQSLGALARTGAFLGGLNALGESNADLTKGWTGEDSSGGHQALADFAKGGALGAAIPVALKGAGWVGQKALGGISNAMDSGAIAAARRVLTGGANLTNAAKKALPEDAVRQALDEGAIRFGGTTKGAAQRLVDLVKSSDESLDTATSALRNAGVTGPDAAMLAQRYGQKADQLGAVYNPGAEKVYRDFADFLRPGGAPGSTPWQPGAALESVSIPGNEAARMTDQELAARLGIGQKPPVSSEIPLDQAIEMKRSLQGDTDYDSLVSKKVNRARKGLAGDFRQHLLEAIQSQSDLHPEAAADYVAQNERLSNLLDASKAATKGANQASKRNALSLRDLLLGQIGTGIVGGAAGGYEGSKYGHGMEGATLGILGGMIGRKYGPSALAALLYQGQAVPRTLAEAAGGRFAQRGLPLALGGMTAGRFGLQPLTLGQLASGGQ